MYNFFLEQGIGSGFIYPEHHTSIVPMLELALICFFFALLLTETPRTLKEMMPGAFPGNVWRMPREKSPQVIPRASDAAVPRSSFPSHTGAVE